MAKILIIGAGVIGSIYGARLIRAGNEVSFLVKRNRREYLQKEGLTITWMNGVGERFTDFRCFTTIPEGQQFDYVLVTVRYENLVSVYPLLNDNLSRNIVFMVNNPAGSTEYLKYVGKEKLIIGFPGAGGEIDNGIVYGHIVSGLIQPTTIGKLSGVDNSGVKELKQILKAAGFPVSVNRDMDSWLINHLAMVCPLGNAIYADGGDNYTASKNNAVIKNTAIALKEAFRFIKKKGVGINPVSNYLFLYCPTSVISFFLRKIYSTKWANTVIANHSLNARNEMHMLSEGFIIRVRERGGTIPFFEKLASYNLGNYSPTG